MSAPQCPDCGRFMSALRATNNNLEGYAKAWFAVATCSTHGDHSVDWDIWLGDFDPEAP